MTKLKNILISSSKNPVLSNLITAAIVGLFSIVFVRTCEERKRKNTKFDFDPANSGTNFVSIAPEYIIGASSDWNEILLDFSRNDTLYIPLFVDYRNGGTEIIESPVVRLETSSLRGNSDKYIFYAELEAENAPKLIDNAVVKNLPAEWKIELYDVKNENTHNKTDPLYCDEKFSYYLTLNNRDVNKLFSSGYQVRDKLELDGGGWCSQGFLIAIYRIIKLI